MSKNRKLIIFTDLDGSLLNHDDYSYAKARPALRMMRSRRIPLIMCTSKTRKEVVELRKEMAFPGPFITENGGGVFFPAEYGGLRVEESIVIHNLKCIPLGVPYGLIRTFLKSASEDYSIRGFGDMSIEEIAGHTGLSREKAVLAKSREFTEPFVIEREERIPSLVKAADEAGIKITRGGRFYHFLGSGNDKGRAVKLTKTVFERNLRSPVTTVGIGDSLNDMPMLEQVDIPILIPHPDGCYEETTLPNIIRAPYPGSRGWNEALCPLLENFKGYQ